MFSIKDWTICKVTDIYCQNFYVHIMKKLLTILLSLLPLLLNAQTFHLLIFADTEGHFVSDAVQAAKTYFQHSFANKIRQNYGYNVNVVAPDRFDISSIESSISTLQTSADDVIFSTLWGMASIR